MRSLLLMAVLTGISDEPYLAWESTVIKPSARRNVEKPVGHRLSGTEIAELLGAAPPLPFQEISVAFRLSDGTVWAGSPRGLMRRGPHDPRWRLFHSRTWLLDDRVVDLLPLSANSVYVKSASGTNLIRQRRTTLSKKMAGVLAQLRQRSIRLGLIGEIELAAPGLVETGWKQTDSDNNGLWTSMYVAAESFHYAVTQDPEARRYAERSLKALMFLETITGTPGYVARSVVPASTRQVHDAEKWRSSRDGKWRWKSDTSSDELDGHFFAYSLYYDLVATPAEKVQIRRVVGRITDHIINNGYYYLDPEGKRTRWGVWAPKEINGDPRWRQEHGLNSLSILSHLKVAAHIVGAKRYDEAARELIEKHHYAENTVNQKIAELPEAVNHSDDELAFLVYYPLLVYERDPKQRAIYMRSIKRSWEIERPEQSPLFNFIYAAALQARMVADSPSGTKKPTIDPRVYDGDACLAWFREVPSDLVYWSYDNTGRRDKSVKPFPVEERGVMKWNGNPYELKRDADGRLCDDGTFILLPYWMGRYHGFID